MEFVIAGIAIIGQLETIYMVIDNIYQYQQKVSRLKDTCREFADFVKEIETVLRTKASHLTKEEMFSVDAKRQLDKLEENLRCAAVLLSNLESPLRIAAYTGVAANKIQELRGQLLESVTLLTFHIVCSPGPSDKQPSDLRDPPNRPLRRNLSHLKNPPNHPLPGTPRRHSSEHGVHHSVSGSSSSKHPENYHPHSPTHYHSTITSQSRAENSTHHHHPGSPQHSKQMSKMACHSSAENVTHHTHYETHQSKAGSQLTSHRPTCHHGDIHHTGAGSTFTSHSHSGKPVSYNPDDNHHQRTSSTMASHSPAQTPTGYHSDDITRSGVRSRILAHTQHHHGSPTHSNHRHDTHQFGGSSNQPPPTRAQSMPSHSASHSQYSRVTSHDPLTARNLFRLLSPYHNPSPEYSRTNDHSGGASRIPRTGSV